METRLLQEALQTKALNLLAEREKMNGLVIVHVASDSLASTQSRIFRFFAAKKDLSDQVFDIVLDESGNIVDPTAFRDNEDVELFARQNWSMDRILKSSAGAAGLRATIFPPVNDLELNLGDVFQEDLTVFIPKTTPETKFDLYLLADTTFYMAPYLDEIKAALDLIFLKLMNRRGLDIAFGVGNYKDFVDSDYPFKHQLSPTTNTSFIGSAIDGWMAEGGGEQDIPEAQLFALNVIAENPDFVGWRTDAKRILLWFGDAPGHEPVCATLSGLPHDITIASLIPALRSQEIVVLALSLTNRTDERGAFGLDMDPNNPLFRSSTPYDICGPAIGPLPKQATKLADATEGTVFHGVGEDDIVNAIISIVSYEVVGIHDMKLKAAGETATFVSRLSQTEIVDLSAFGVQIKFKAEFQGRKQCAREAQVFEGTIDVDIDGNVNTSKALKITVPFCPSIEPNENNLELKYGDTFTEEIAVSIPTRSHETKYDLYFLADTTGSMQPFLDAVKRSLSGMLSTLSGRGLDVAFGLGNYKDFSDDPHPFWHQLSLTTNFADITREINAWREGGGGYDEAEAQLYALNQIAENPNLIGWRADAKRIIIWFGDAPGHEPICAALSGLSHDINVGSLIQVLNRQHIIVLAISLARSGGTGGLDVDANALPLDPDGPFATVCGRFGRATLKQATEIAAATGGSVVNEIGSDRIVDEIKKLVSNVVTGVEIELVSTGETRGFVEGTSSVNVRDLSVDGVRVKFTVDFRGTTVGTDREQNFAGTIDALVNGEVKVSKTLKVTVPPATFIKIALAPSAAVVRFATASEEQIFVFAMDSDGEVAACSHNGNPEQAASWSWTHLGAPIDTQIQSNQWQTVFGIASYFEHGSERSGVIHAFTVCHDGHLYEVSFDGSQWATWDRYFHDEDHERHPASFDEPQWATWVDYGSPALYYGGLALALGGPTAVTFRRYFGEGDDRLSQAIDHVATFIVGTDGGLHHHGPLNSSTLHTNGWHGHGKPPGQQSVSSMVGLIRSRNSGFIFAYLVGFDRHLYVNHSTNPADATDWTWIDLGQPDSSTGVAYMQRPSIVDNGQLLTFVIGDDSHLWVNIWQGPYPGDSGTWYDQGAPVGVTGLSAVSVVTYSHEGRDLIYAFVCGSNGHLYVNVWGVLLGWKDLGHPQDVMLNFDPTAVICAHQDRDPIYVFVQGTDGFLHMCHMDSGITNWQWLELSRENRYPGR